MSCTPEKIWHDLEKRALTGDRDAVSRVISGFRWYRQSWNVLVEVIKSYEERLENTDAEHIG